MQKIVPHLWFDKEAEEAAQFYMSVFEDSKLIDRTILNNTPSGTADMLTIELAGQEFILLSAGPYFKFTPAISFIIACSSVGEVEKFYEKLIGGGMELMPLDTYPFSEKYSWLLDKYGLSWQIMYTGDSNIRQKITPSFLFVGDQCGKTEEAVKLYTSIFKDSRIGGIQRYGEDAAPDKPDTIRNMSFTLENQDFTAMDSAYNHKFTFTEAISFVVSCDTQEEIDYYWDKLTHDPDAEQCGWLKDRFGISWQIVPVVMKEMMKDKNSESIGKVTEAFLKMKKFDIAELIKAYKA